MIYNDTESEYKISPPLLKDEVFGDTIKCYPSNDSFISIPSGNTIIVKYMYFEASGNAERHFKPTSKVTFLI
jgi:hypothetical protein